jgi:hypothetical protein
MMAIYGCVLFRLRGFAHRLHSKYATNTTLQISETYSAARTFANSKCGPEFSPLVGPCRCALFVYD